MEKIKESRRALPPSHQSYLGLPSSGNARSEGGGGSKRVRRRKDGSNEDSEHEKGTEFSSRCTTLEDDGDGWNDYCLECGGAGELWGGWAEEEEGVAWKLHECCNDVYVC